MKGDFSRSIRDGRKHYSGVLHQQGRVWLDSDWNEEEFERRRLLEQETIDIIGTCGVPEPGTAFQISPNPNAPTNNPGDFLINGGPGKQGHAYVDGILAEMDAPTTYLTQPDLPDPPPIVMPSDGSDLNALVYLEVWHRLITYLEDDSIREVALGGPDTTTRIKTIAQVKVVPIPPGSTKDLTCPSVGGLLPTAGNATLTTLAAPPPLPTDLCRLPDPGNYTGRENRLYRVEIHTPGGLAGSQVPARFKWSRNNASFAVSVTAVSADRQTLTVSSLGRDQATALRQGDLVEICDDASELGPARGHLTQLSSDPDPDQLTVTIADPLPSTFQNPGGTITSPPSPPSSPPSSLSAPRHMILRRWDGAGTPAPQFDPVSTPDMDLGDGVHIQFGGSDLRSGDFWQFTARTDGSLEALTNEPPRGILRHRCPLAIVNWTRPVISPPGSPANVTGPYTMTVLHDCRVIFPPLAERAIHVMDVTAIDPKQNRARLLNDTVIQPGTVFGGIDILTDADVVPPALSRAVCFVTVEIPIQLPNARADNQSPIVYVPVVVQGDTTAAGTTISWRPRAGGIFSQLPFALLPQADKGMLVRLTLKGNFVWSPQNPSVFLDGDAFGQNQAGLTSLRLPSGDGRRGGTFETWFWLGVPPVPPPLTFTLATTVAQLARAEGITELVGDLVLIGTGGNPTAAGVPVPAMNIQLVFNSAVTTRPAGQGIDTVLRIDEPTTLNGSSFGQFPPPAITGVGGDGVSYQSGAVPNMYEGQLGQSQNTVLLTGIPIDPPGFGTRTIRISNLRVNASASLSGTAGSGITVLISINNQTLTANLGSPQSAIKLFELTNPDNTVPPPPLKVTNAQMNTDPQNAKINLKVHAQESFAGAFKSLQLEQPPVVNPSLGVGVVTQGTQFQVTFNFSSSPGTVQIFVTMVDMDNGQNLKLISLNGVPNPTQAGKTTTGVPLAQAPIHVNGVGTAIALWEWVSNTPATSIRDLHLGVALFGSVAAGTVGPTVQVQARIQPVSGVTIPTTDAPMPRFIDHPFSSSFVISAQ